MRGRSFSRAAAPAAAFAALLAVPLLASAHALPVSYDPASSAVVDTAPSQVTITFSEDIDASASSLHVTGPSGAIVSGPLTQDPKDPHVVRAALSATSTGVYQVNWSAVSADDGHFTKGSYAYAVGSGTPPPSTDASGEVVEIATVPEAAGMTVELLGNGIVWATLLLWIFGVRPLLNEGKREKERRALARGYGFFLLAAVGCILVGGAWQLYVKSAQLASLQAIALLPAFWMYLKTAAGWATAGRMLAGVLVAGAYLLGRARIASARRVTPFEIAMIVFMCAFAWLRAKISHATANPFYPDFSILMNFFHLIEKDLLAGTALLLLVLVLVPRLRAAAADILPHAFEILGIDLALVSVTASYIIWLHLKSFANLFSTAWGSALQQLVIAAVLLVALRSYHVFARLWKPKLFGRFLPLTLAAEFGFGLLVVYCSSVIIITSPPLSAPDAKLQTAHDQGVTITLGPDAYEDGMALLTTTATATTPTVLVAADGAQPVPLTLAKRFDGGYVFPLAVLPGNGTYAFQVTSPQASGYDAHAAFRADKEQLMTAEAAHAPHGGRTFDLFTWEMIALALAACAYGVLLSRLSRLPARAAIEPVPYAAVLSLVVFAVIFSGGATALAAFTASSWSNPFAAECNGDGNEWHSMLPSLAGKAVSQTPAEGCMWGMGSYMYMFADRREYQYYESQPQAKVTLDPVSPTAGMPATLHFVVRNADGSPADLFVDMDKYVHVVIVSKDETFYAHVHPDNADPASDAQHYDFSLPFTFPMGGDYLVNIDYAHGLALESSQFVVHVAGGPAQQPTVKQYPGTGTFNGYTVQFDPGFPAAGQVDTVRFTISKDGKPVTDLVPYLDAAMHVAVIKDDFSAHLHVHGEVHPPGTPLPPIIVKNGQVIHSMAAMILPPTFGPVIESHLIFPSPGLYTVWGEFKEGSVVTPAAFTVQVQ